ncbi:hypothetical protein K1719_031920 [Acacia pycnantha]|nr:hypothetical protein K1719_031920 [Acacia pycnantha]
MNSLLENLPCDASMSRAFVPNLDSSDSFASILSLQITLFPNKGFSIGVTSHHACADGKSSTMFIKAWAYLCRKQAENESSGLLPQELQPFLDKEVIIDPRGIGAAYIDAWLGFDVIQKKQSLKIMYDIFAPKVKGSARATFELKRGDLDRIKDRVLQKWESHKVKDERADSTVPKPQSLSTFVLTAAYVWICLEKAMEITEQRTKKILFGFMVDCRSRLEPPIPENYFGNCVMPQFTETLPENPSDIEDGIVIAAKEMHRKISKIQKEKGALDGAETLFSRFSLLNEDSQVCVGVAGSTHFGVYQADFGWGRPEKVEITSVDRNISMGMAESKDGDGGVEVGLVLKQHLMDQFASLFQRGIK